MEMYQVRYFLSVARTLNFTRAAEDCGVAQPSLSRAIKQLEAELGGELFRRERPQAILTELGHRISPILTRCFESAAAAQALAAGIGKGGAATLRVALSPTIGIKLVLAALQEAERVFEGLELVVRRESAAGTLDLLKAGEVEVAMAGDILEAQPWLDRFPLFDEGYLLISAREHRLANSVGFGLEELRDERIVLSRHAEDADALAALAPSKRRHDAWSDADVAALVGAGLGVAIGPRSFPRPESLAATPLERFDLRRTVSAFAAAGRPRSAPAAMLINLLRATNWDAATA